MEALLEKYGQPTHTSGTLRTVRCRNKLGAIFEGFKGYAEYVWPVKEGVQGRIVHIALTDCDELLSDNYSLTHVATKRAIEDNEAEKKRKEAEERRRKLGGAF